MGIHDKKWTAGETKATKETEQIKQITHQMIHYTLCTYTLSVYFLYLYTQLCIAYIFKGYFVMHLQVW